LRNNLLEVNGDLSDSDYKQFHRLVQEMALRAYPNPDRIGCPGREALEEVASLTLSSRHELFQGHISHCSPCLAELLEIRRRKHREKMRARRTRWIVAAAASSIILAITITLIITGHQTATTPLITARKQPVAAGEQTARLNLSDETGLRSDERTRKTEIPHQLPPRRLNLSVTLPFGSPAGPYEFGIFRLDQTPLAMTSGDAQISAGTTILHVHADLSRYSAGQYLVGVRRGSGDWTLHELTIR
jgi:hypothetical protein